MKAFTALLKVSFKSLLLTTAGMGSRRKNRKKAASGIGALVLLSILMLYISGTYSFSMAAALAPMGGLDIMLLLILPMALLFPLVFTVFSSQSMIFSTRDIDLVLSLPVSAFAVMLSRVMALYLEVLLLVETLLLPAGLAWHVFGGEGPVLVTLLVAGVFLSFLPTALALLFGGVISLLVSRLRFKNLFITVFSVLLMGLILVGSFQLSFSMETIATDVDGLRLSLQAALGPLAVLVQGIVQTRVPVLLAAVAACLVPFFLITWVFSLFYKSLLTLLSSHTLKQNYKLRRLAATGSFAALLKKEARRFFGTPAYLMNSGIGTIMALGAAVFAVFQRDTIQATLGTLLGMEGGAALGALLPLILLGILGFFLMMSNPAATSVSLEGKQLWILKEAPVGTGRIFAAKAGFNLLLTTFQVCVTVPLAGYAFALPPLHTLGMVILGLLFGLLVSVSGLFLNLLLPRLDAENDTIVIKQSSSVIASMLLNLVFIALVAGLYFLLRAAVPDFFVFSLAAALLLAGLCALFLGLLNTKGRRLFAEL